MCKFSTNSRDAQISMTLSARWTKFVRCATSQTLFKSLLLLISRLAHVALPYTSLLIHLLHLLSPLTASLQSFPFLYCWGHCCMNRMSSIFQHIQLANWYNIVFFKLLTQLSFIISETCCWVSTFPITKIFFWALLNPSQIELSLISAAT